MSEFLEIFKKRGYFHQCTDETNLGQLMQTAPITAYVGFDCTAKSLHVGNLMMIMCLRLLQKMGHRPIVIVGGGTTKIGDPSGKDEARKMLTDADIKENTAGIKTVLGKFIKFGSGEGEAVLLNNDEWLSHLNYLDFLRDYGKYFSVNRMLSFDSVKLRLEREQNLSFLEFNYMIFQAYDFVELNRRYNCRLQFGGSDQWGNIVNGVELNRRLGEQNVFGLTVPLITTASGAKMGKSVNGAVWLSEELLSHYEYYQFWRNAEDNDVVKFLRLFTELSDTDIDQLAMLRGNEINEAKKILAFEATKLCHGEEAAHSAQETARKTFEEGALSEGLPVLEVTITELSQGIAAYELLSRSSLVSSNGEARRLIRGKGARVNDVVVTDENQLITSADIQNNEFIKLSSGKKHHVLVKATS